MAKEVEKKRKLEQDQADRTPTKRRKATKNDTKKAAANGSESPQVVITRQSSPSATPRSSTIPVLSRSQRKAATKQAKRDAESFLKDFGREIPSSSAEQVEVPLTPNIAKARGRKSAEDCDDDNDIQIAPVKIDNANGVAKMPMNVQDIEQPDSGASHAISTKSKKKKKNLQNEDALVPVQEDTRESKSSVADQPERAGSSKKKEKASRKENAVAIVKEEKSTTPNANGWSLSVPSAGRYLDHDPEFVQDANGQDFVVAATAREAQLLSLETSLIVRSHVVPDGRSIVCFAKSTTDASSIDIAYDNGTKVRWNWLTEEVNRGTFPAQEHVDALTTAIMTDKHSESFYITHENGQHAVIGERKSLYTTQRRLTGIKVLHEGAYIICLSVTALIIGARKAPDQAEYSWIEIPVEMPLRCFDARLIFSRSDRKKQGRRPELTVAVGNAEGQIHLYSDMSSLFASSSSASLSAPRILHWHRQPVSAVKFSRDGDYLISGGKETVLVIWQLETGKQQHLPHLGSEIERIVVSPDGTRYALQMGDNSIMVLSTSELKPVANVAGLQLPVLTEHMAAQDILLPRANAILHPRDPHRLLLTVPSTQPKTINDISTRPFLQTFDIRHSRHISRQALTRNNISDFITGPEKTPVFPPDVALMAVSADGQWLATVDEWIPPAMDLAHLVSKTTGLDATDLHEIQEERERRREIYIKFWRWNETQQMWTLSTRADSPHALPSNAGSAGPGRIIKLASDPSSNCFATVGEDKKIKIWRPKTRMRHGTPLKDANGDDEVDYVCRHTIPLPVPCELADRADSPMQGSEEEVDKDDILEDACLTFSQDGSMLACAQVTNNDNALPLVYFVSPSTGAVIASKTGLVAAEQELLDLAFVDRYFVTLSTRSVRVWNLIDDSHHYSISIAANVDQDEAMLAVSQSDETFAVVFYHLRQGTDEPTPRIEVYSPRKTQCVFGADLSAVPVAILANSGVKGFTILFQDGTIRTLATNASSIRRGSMFANLNNEESAATQDVLAVVEDTEGDQLLAGMGNLALPAGEVIAGDNVEDDRPVVRPEQLANVLDVGQSFALPPVSDMFSSIVDLFARKPRKNAVKAEDDLVMVD